MKGRWEDRLVHCLLMFMVVARAEEPTLAVDGFVESYGSWNFNRPANGLTALRGFDAHHAHVTLSLASLGIEARHPVARGRVAIQAGPTAASLALAEPLVAGGPGVAGTGPDVMVPLREAWAGLSAPTGAIAVDAGLFLSPVGYDAAAAKDNRLWSLSDLGFGLPFYLAGARATVDASDRTVWTVGLFDGWNSLVSPTGGRSVGTWLQHETDRGTRMQVLYLGGDESPDDETRGWRHLGDLWVDAPVGPIDVVGHVDAGLEHREGGPHSWVAVEGIVVWHATATIDVAARGDVFREPSRGRIFFPTATIGSGTLGVGWRPAATALVRAEVRHDRAAGEVFFGPDRPFVATETSQTTVTIGVTTWFDAAL